MKTMKFALAIATLAAISIASATHLQVRSDRGGGSRHELEATIYEADIKTFLLKIGAGDQTLARGNGGGAGKATYSDLSIVINSDKASPSFFKNCVTGQHIPKAILFVRKQGDDKRQDYYRIIMEDVVVSSYNFSPSHGEDRPMESISFNYAKIEFEYKPQEKK